MRSEFEKWFKTSRSYLALKDANYYDLNLFEFNESYKRYVHSGIQIAFETWQHQQAKVDELEAQLVEWKQKSMPLMLNGMCGSCRKEPLQRIISDRVDYALLHCFGCGANKYEFVGEQALKGGEG
ncbi:MAG: hypothetical protein RR676_17510 [Acinetobacter sp.]